MAQQKGKLQIAAQELQKIVDGDGMSKNCSVFDDGPARTWTEQEKAFAAQLKRTFQGYFRSWVKDHLARRL